VARSDDREEQPENVVNVTGDVIGGIHISKIQPGNVRQVDANVLLRRGIQQLEAGSYRLARQTLNEAIHVDHSLRMAYYHAAMAILEGRRPKALSRTEVQRIDELLRSAIAMDPLDSLFHWFRALVRDDYYRSHGLTCPPPSVSAVVSDARAGRLERDELRMLLSDVNVPPAGLYRELTALMQGGRA
jgi:hypothetical protein